MKKPRLIASLAAAPAAVAAIFLIPTPYYVWCGLYLEPRGAASVYVEAPGHLQQIHVRAGDWVRGGQPLVTLDNVDLRLAVTELAGQKRQLEAQLLALQQRAFEEQAAAVQIAEVQEAIAALDEQLAKRRQDQARLQITAPVSGVVIPPPRVPDRERDPRHLPNWSGSPLEEHNVSAFLKESVPVCQIGDPQQLKALLAIDQADVEFVHVGQPVDIFLEQLPGRKYRSRLQQLSQQDMKITPQSLSSKVGGELLTRTDAGGQERPLSTTYQASAPLTDEDGLLFIGTTGKARIHAGRRTLARRLWRYLCQTFHFDVS